jgi:hypothetical protein
MPRKTRREPSSQEEGQQILVDAERAGADYAQEQIGSSHFHNWVYEQMVEAEQMRQADPSSVFPIESPTDANKLARNMLQQLQWDTKRAMDTQEILELSGASGVFSAGSADWVRDTYGITERDVSSAFYTGFDEKLQKPSNRQWLTDLILEFNEELRGSGAREMREASPKNQAMNADDFVQLLASMTPADRQTSIRFQKSFAGERGGGSVYVNFINLPQGIGGAGGGAEAENNRASFWIHGFQYDPSVPVAKVKVDSNNNVFHRSWLGAPAVPFRAKSGSPTVVAKHLADYLARVVATVPPRFTHTAREPRREVFENGVAATSKWVRPSYTEMFANGKPIVVTKVGRKYTVHVMGAPVYRGTDGKLNFFGRPDAVAGMPAEKFNNRSDADHIAHQIGHYMLGLGDFVDTYVDHRNAKDVHEVREVREMNFQQGERLRIRVKGPNGQPFESFWYTVDTQGMTLEELALQFAQTGQSGTFIEIVSGKLKWTYRVERFAGQTAVTRVRGGAPGSVTREAESVTDPFYIIQGLYNGPEAYGAGASFGFDDEETALKEAKKLLREPWFEGDYVRIITRDGELVWDSRGGKPSGYETARQSAPQHRRRRPAQKPVSARRRAR